jgi:mannose-1-phosphate guanylyltransferase
MEMSDPPARPIIPVILSGGSGTRLWPLSRGARPKQMLDLLGAGSMLGVTAGRVADEALFSAPVLVAAASQAEAIEAALPGLGGLILEPEPRNTAPAIALAALTADADDLLLVLPSDHLIGDADGFRHAVRRAAPFAHDGWIVTFGMKAERGETGYGYIERGPALGDGVHQAVRFVEKPDAATAGRYAAGRRHDWNGGIFLMRAGTYLDALAGHAPEIADAAKAAMAGARREGRRTHPDAAAFAASPAQSIDYAVMEKADKVAVLPVAIGWSDIGSWDALHAVAARDAAGNAIAGDVLALDARNCLIRSEGPLVAAIGVEDLVVIATADAVLIVPRAQSQRVKEAVEALKDKGRDEWI